MNGSARVPRRLQGEPLLVLGLIIGGWLALRIALWEPPFGLPIPAAISVPSARIIAQQDVKAGAVLPSPARRRDHRSAIQSSPVLWPTLALHGVAASAEAVAVAETPSTDLFASQRALLAAAFAHMRLPPSLAVSLAGQAKPMLAGEPALAPAALPGAPAVGRWSGDAWLLARNGSVGPIAAGQPSYGRSQAGAVLRYALAPSSDHLPVFYARATRALAGPRESEAAMGLGARPIAGVPLRVAGEVRVSDNLLHREIRPAAFAVTELPPAKLPLSLRAEAYVQAGYVGGRFATAFVDGQARLDGLLASIGRDAALRVGAGVWGGAQDRAARLDLGPSLAAAFRLGRTQARIALDYRLRVAGDAEPKSGPALTISAGF